MGFKEVEGKRGFAITEPAITFLKHRNLRGHLLKHFDNTFRAAQPVSAHSLMDVVTCKPDHTIALADRRGMEQCDFDVMIEVDYHIIM